VEATNSESVFLGANQGPVVCSTRCVYWIYSVTGIRPPPNSFWPSECLGNTPRRGEGVRAARGGMYTLIAHSSRSSAAAAFMPNDSHASRCLPGLSLRQLYFNDAQITQSDKTKEAFVPNARVEKLLIVCQRQGKWKSIPFGLFYSDWCPQVRHELLPCYGQHGTNFGGFSRPQSPAGPHSGSQLLYRQACPARASRAPNTASLC